MPRAIDRRSTSGDHADLARVDAENRLATLEIGIADHHLTIEPSRTKQRRIEDVLAVGGGDDDDALMAFEAVHFHEQLIQRLLALLVAERVAAAAAADGVELVDEDDAGAVAARLAEQLAHARGADARVHLDEVRAAREQERHAGFARDRPRQQRLAGSRRADEEHALGNPAADSGEPLRLAEEIDDFLDFVLGFVDARDILERDDVAAALGDARARRDRRNLARGRAIHGECEQGEEGGRRWPERVQLSEAGSAGCAPRRESDA